jgi:hypothetical protein
MSGDYSRIDFNPWHNYNGVLLQQGRPLTDSDWNDQVAGVNRRIQAGTLDTVGQTFVSKATPDAFKITSDGQGGLLIGRGRFYVDGLLAENHGTGATQWDVELAELFGTQPVAYTKQPYWPTPTPLPTSGGSQIVYLDVWEREVTQYEDPQIVEKALGVDTTTRLQTVWQVKLIDPGTTVDCSTPLDGNAAWTAATAPSAGRLSSDTADVPGDSNPCIIPPTGGYKGLENQLYRVEIHKKGPLGTATFKWSRDNASVETRVTKIVDPSNIVVESLGKDQVLSFSDGDWIEITDNWLELNGQPGELHKIKVGGGVETATRTITLATAITGSFPTDAQGNVDPNRCTRIRRWDQKGTILDQNGNAYANLDSGSSDGAIVVPAGGLSLLLESGIIVSFSVDPSGGAFHVGDYWVFAARTVDASIEKLKDAPPRGIHHHYAKLAVFTPPGTVEDCRPEGEGCCCVTVAPGDDIQAAIDRLPDAGGCVCLKAGVHAIKTAITITHSYVKLVGESMGAMVRLVGDGAALLIGTPKGGSVDGVEVARVQFERQGQSGGGPIIGLTSTTFSAIEDCLVRDIAPQNSIGIFLDNCLECRVTRCVIQSVSVGIAAGGPLGKDLRFDHNVIESQVRDAQPAQCGIVVADITGPCRAEGNTITGMLAGVVVNANVATPQSEARGSVVTGNTISCVPLPGGTNPGPSTALIGIDMAAPDSVVADNRVAFSMLESAAHTGIRVTGANVSVTGNTIAAEGGAAAGNTKPIGIEIGFVDANQNTVATTAVRACANTISGVCVGIAATDAINVILEQNIITTIGNVTDPTASAGITLTRILGGQARDNTVAAASIGIGCFAGVMTSVTGNNVANGGYGIGLTQEIEPVVAQNHITNMAFWGVTFLGTTGRCDAVGNRISSCGYGMSPGAGIGAYTVLGELNIASNEIANTGISLDGATLAPIAFGIGGVLVLEARVESNLVTYANPAARPVTGDDRALLMMGYLDIVYRNVEYLSFPIHITGNTFVGPGAAALVQLPQKVVNDFIAIRFDRVFFSNNYCKHMTAASGAAGGGQTGATVVLTGRAAIVTANHIKAMTASYASVDFGGEPGPCIGNVLSGAVINHGTSPALDGSFNMVL